MAGRIQQDAFMEDSEDTCPLCVEEFDLSDKNFRPCPCGYQICQFCYNNIKNNMNGLCPACRRQYDDKNIEWKLISPEEFKADIANQARKKAAARQKEAERRQVETLNRKHLQGLRVVQRNLVYITGMGSEGVPDEQLEDQLKGNAVFGQYGKIIKLSANKLKDTGGGNAALAIFITFADEDSANRCISALDGRVHQGRILKAQHGTTKYCSAFLRNETCNNRNCTFLHEAGEDRDSFSRQELSSLNAASSQARPQQTSTAPLSRPQPTSHAASLPLSSVSASHKTESMSRSDSGDGPALPSTANWAKNPQIHQSRRSSQAASRATPSPKVMSAKTVTVIRPESRTSTKAAAATDIHREREFSKEHESVFLELHDRSQNQDDLQMPAESPSETFMKLRNLFIRTCSEPLTWKLDRSVLDEEILRAADAYAPLIESNGGLARQFLKDRRAKTREKQEDIRSLVQPVTLADEEEHRISGSLQLGGEPDLVEDTLEPTGNRIGPTGISGHQSFEGSSTNTPSFVQSSLNDFSAFDHGNRSVTPQQRGGVSLLKNAQDNDPILQQFQRAPNTSQHQSTLSNPFQGQNPVLSGHSRHGRQSSRYTFANDLTSATTTVKPMVNSQLVAQQPAIVPSQNKSYSAQHNMQSGFYSGVQGPPPGLKSSGTPPISGGGMFGQGHGFTNAMGGSLNFGPHIPAKPNNENDPVLIRSRAGTGGGLGPESGKRQLISDSGSKAQSRGTQSSLVNTDDALFRVALRGSEQRPSPSTSSLKIDEEFPPLQASRQDNSPILIDDTRTLKQPVSPSSMFAQDQVKLDAMGSMMQIRPVLELDSQAKRKVISTSTDASGQQSLTSVDMLTEENAVDRKSHGRIAFKRQSLDAVLEDLTKDEGLDKSATHDTSPSRRSIIHTGTKQDSIFQEDHNSSPKRQDSQQSTATSSLSVSKPLRTLRVVDTVSTEAPAKITAPKVWTAQVGATSSASTSAVRETSRRHSLTSINVPSTPSNELHSETASTVESHPSSPAGGKPQIGLSRLKTKSQVKKDRRARKAEESKLSETVAANLSESEVRQEAIVGRKKKAKKSKLTSQKNSSNTQIEVLYNPIAENNDIDANDEEKIADADAETTTVNEENSDKSITLKEQIENLNINKLLGDMVDKGDLDRDTVSLALDVLNWKASVPGTVAQTSISPLSLKEKSTLEAGEPIVVASTVADDTEKTIPLSKHPYPYSLILPNAQRTVLPMATKQEADLSVNLYRNLFREGLGDKDLSSGILAFECSVGRSTQITHLSPADLSLSYFSTLQEALSEVAEAAIKPSRNMGGVHSEISEHLKLDDELILCDPASRRWMNEATCEIQSNDTALGGNYFERSRAAALGRGPLRLDLIGGVAPSAPTTTPPPPPPLPPPPPPPPMSTHPVLGARPGNGFSGSSSAHRSTGKGIPELWDLFKNQIDVVGEPLQTQDLSEELEKMNLAEAGGRLREIEEYVARLRKEAEIAEKRFISLAKRNSRQLRPQSKTSRH